MIDLLGNIYDNLLVDSSAGCVILQGAGEKAFCAGGDVVSIYHKGLAAKKDKDEKVPSEFFRREYIVDNKIANLNKPHVALIDGITMGGGVGVSVHGKFRVATEKSLFAMPETGIGLFPDVGGSHFLPHLNPKNIGFHLALTGAHVRGGGVLKHLGIATHAVQTADLDKLKSELLALPSLCSEHDVAQVLHNFDTIEASPLVTPEEEELIANVYDVESFEECWQNLSELRANGNEWATRTMATLEKVSAISVRVAFEQLKRGATLSLADCLEMEFVIVQRFLREHDFYEGVRAQLVDKDRKPVWSKSLSEITDADVDRYFRPDDDYDLLKLVDWNSSQQQQQQ
eukprot:CAMPEP_0168599842 /NCGR_PEP_ID=MMETSP0420-20121227/12366_1 /TAXON_ID=498008 /ORGANISM="Pessonella sp." /LENGTH=342 /DNA_ID=CAMNT_0008637693 /DNA_START=104 /DNA_END=1129 /DNA_ORIENTATION=-